MIISNKLSHHRGYHLEIVLTAFTRLSRWKLDNGSAPFWRLYHNLDEGASVAWAGENCSLGPGCLVLIPPNTPFSTRLEGSVYQFFTHFMLGYPYDVFPAGLHQLAVTSADRQVLEKLLDPNAPLPKAPETMFAVFELISRSLQRLPADLWPPPVTDPRIAKAMNLMQHGLGSSLTNAELASSVSLSTNAFSRLFRSQTGQSPQQYLMTLRLNYACIQLNHSNKSIEEIAEESGFRNRYYFSRMFKKYRQTSPAAYRKHLRV